MNLKKNINFSHAAWPFQGLVKKRVILLATLIVAFVLVFTAIPIDSQTAKTEEEPSGCGSCEEQIEKLCTECRELMEELGIDCNEVLKHIRCFPSIQEDHWRGEYYVSGELVRIRDDGNGRGFRVRFYDGQEIGIEQSECIVGKPDKVSWTKTVMSKGGVWGFTIRKPNRQRYGGGMSSSSVKISVDGFNRYERNNSEWEANISAMLPEGKRTILIEYWPKGVTARGDFHFFYDDHGLEVLPPVAPSSLTATCITESEQVRLNWIDNSDNENHFELERRSGTKEWEIIAGPGIDETSHNDKDSIAPVTTYEYRIKATNSAGSSEYSNIATVTAIVSPAAPSGLEATLISPGGDGIELTWTNNSRYEVWFELQIDDETSHVDDLMVLPGKETTYRLLGVKRGATYAYRVRAKTDWGTSEWSGSTRISVPELTDEPTLSLEVLDSGSPILKAANRGVKPNYSNRQGRYVQYSNPQNLARGLAAGPAVASTTIAGFTDIHGSKFVCDGYYGNGSSWVGTSANSCIKIDLGDELQFNRIQFGRDRTDNGYSDRSPGQFIIFVADIDRDYLKGTEIDDSTEYRMIFDSSEHEFSGMILSPQSVLVSFPTEAARYVKIQFSASGAAIDEVEVWHEE